MTCDFFRFPQTPHIAWLGKGSPRDDKVLSPPEVEALLAGEVLVEEKIDGANLGISWGANQQLQAQNRGQYLSPPFDGQFSRLTAWFGEHESKLREHLAEGLILFGEWCAAKHSLEYPNLPDWFVVFDVYDRAAQKFYCSARRDDLAAAAGLSTVPAIYRGNTTLKELRLLLQTSPSLYRDGPPEGIVIRRQSAEWCEARAKLVRAEFTQSIAEHWRSRAMQWNRVRLRQDEQEG